MLLRVVGGQDVVDLVRHVLGSAGGRMMRMLVQAMKRLQAIDAEHRSADAGGQARRDDWRRDN